MDPNGMINFMNLITLGCGIYCLYLWFQLRGGKIPPKFPLLGRELTPEKCLDEEYYISYMRPRLLFFGVLVTVVGVFNMLDRQLGLLQAWLPEGAATVVALIVDSLLPFGAVVWFAICINRIQKELW